LATSRAPPARHDRPLSRRPERADLRSALQKSAPSGKTTVRKGDGRAGRMLLRPLVVAAGGSCEAV
jgi:hypothetical protein